jgi:alpha-methylacyl-CoA racemase
MNQTHWPTLTARLAQIFRSRTRDAWCAHFAGTEVCFAPVLSLAEAPGHPQNLDRGVFVDIDGVVQPAPLPKFSATPARVRHGPNPAGSGGAEALREWGIDADAIERVRIDNE